jgi:DNA repair protein RadC
VKDLAFHDRPREKLARHGAASLGDNELLALVLTSGTGGRDVLTIAGDLLAAAGGVQGLPGLSPADLARQPGIGPARAAQVLAALELGRRTLMIRSSERVRLSTPQQLATWLIPQFGAARVEQFGIVMLDTRHRLIRAAVLSVGSLDATVVHPREVFREAAGASASAIVLFHNHPSGDPTPSQDDLALTQRLVRAGEVMGIRVADHLVLAHQHYYSFLEAGRLPR